MHKMKGLADIMATAGAPITDDELIDHILTGIGSAFNPSMPLSVLATPR